MVVNLSSKPLNSAESSLLSKGLNVCPNPPKINVRELDEDLDQFARRLRIKEYFHSKKETSEDLSTYELDIKEVIDIPKFVKKSNWIPKPSKNTRLESVIDLIRSDIKHNVDVHIPKTDNLTQAERSAFRDIQERNDIIIRPADKGSAVVVMDKITYLQQAERQLSNCRFCEKLDSDPTLDFTQKITRVLDAMHARGHIDDKTMEYLTPEDSKPCRFYLLPKIHKENNPGRPIVSANGHPTEKISEFIDFHLRPFVENFPSHIKDTTDYLKKMENLNILENTTLVTMDVTSLYTNITHDDGIAACRKIWEQRTVQDPPTECLVEMLTLVLKNNNLQINGTAMGTKLAPSYANIFMGELEERLLLSSLKQPLSWFRFIDDVDMKWIHSDKELDEFFEHANSIHPSIKFTHEVSKTIMSFLDTTTTVKEGNMTTDLYSNPTDKHQYLSPSSCHPKHCFKSIPFSQAIRVKRICSTVETTKQRLGDLRHHLKRRVYNDKVIVDRNSGLNFISNLS